MEDNISLAMMSLVDKPFSSSASALSDGIPNLGMWTDQEKQMKIFLKRSMKRHLREKKQLKEKTGHWKLMATDSHLKLGKGFFM